jgi:perosamine synthetase
MVVLWINMLNWPIKLIEVVMYNIKIYEPYFTKENMRYAHEVLDSGNITSGYKYYNEVIDLLKDKFGYKYILLTSSGTTANHLMAKCIAKKFSSNIVLVPNNVYVASWNPFFYDKLFNLFYIDCDINTWNIDISNKFKNDYPYIFLAVHNLGNPIDIPYLKEIYPNFVIVEDNCEGLGGKYRGRYTGTESIFSTLSFYTNKNITSGEGGAFITNNEESYEYAKLIHGQGQSNKRYIHNVLGYNYRMTALQAAILYGQLKDYDIIMKKKKDIFTYYRNIFKDIPNIKLQIEELHCEHSNWMFGIRILGNPIYETAQGYFNKLGIETRPMFYPITYHNHLKHLNGESIINAELLSKECFMLPSHPLLIEEELKYIVEKVIIYSEKIGG